MSFEGFPRPTPNNGDGLSIKTNKSSFVVDTGQTIKKGDKVYWYNKNGILTAKKSDTKRFQAGSRYIISNVINDPHAIETLTSSIFIMSCNNYLIAGKINSDGTITYGTYLNFSGIIKKIVRLTDSTFLLDYDLNHQLYIAVGSVDANLNITVGTGIYYDYYYGEASVMSPTRVCTATTYNKHNISLKTYSVSGITLTLEYSASDYDPGGYYPNAVSICGLTPDRFIFSWCGQSSMYYTNVGNISGGVINLGTYAGTTPQEVRNIRLHRYSDTSAIIRYTYGVSYTIDIVDVVNAPNYNQIQYKNKKIGTELTSYSWNASFLLMPDGNMYIGSVSAQENGSVNLLKFKIAPTSQSIFMTECFSVDPSGSYYAFLATCTPSRFIILSKDDEGHYVKIIDQYDVSNGIALMGGTEGKLIKCNYW